jgi:subtilisin family serine protease
MKRYSELIRSAAIAAAVLALLLRPDAARPREGGDEEGLVVSGLVTFEVEAGAAAAGLERAVAGSQALEAAFDVLEVTDVRPYFIRPSRPPETPEEERLSRIYRARYASTASPEEAARVLLAVPEIRAASPVPLRFVAGLPNDERFSEQWGLRQGSDVDMDAPEAWDVFRGDSAVVVAVLDTGVDRIHPDLGGISPSDHGNVWVNAAEAAGAEGVDDDDNGYVDDIWGWDWVDYEYEPGQDYPPWPGEDYLEQDGDPADFHGHGSAVAGVVGAVANNAQGIAGVLWRCGVMGLRCGLALNTGGPSPAGAVRMDWCAMAVVYATDMGAAAINASWESGYEVGLEAAVDYAVSRGVVVAVAAGNRAKDPADLAQLNYLSSRGDCVDVAAIQRDGRRWHGSNFGDWVDVCAPGSDVLTIKFVRPDYRGYSLWSGTSFAAPAVAATAALIRRDHSGWSAEQVRDYLRLTSVALSPEDTTIGSGLVNVFNAVRPEDGGWSLNVGSDAATPVLPVAGPAGVEALAAGLSDGRAAAWRPTGEGLDSWPVKLSEAAVCGVAAGDLDADGEPEVVFVDEQGSVSVLGLDGSIESSFVAGAPPVGAPVLADLSGDGALEVLLAAADGTLHAWNAAGVPLSGWPVGLDGAPSGSPAAGDVDEDGAADAVVACVGGSLYCIGADGLDKTGWPVSVEVSPGTSPTLADVAGEDGIPEIVVCGLDGLVYGWDAFGAPLEGWPLAATGAVLPARISIGDVDGDSTGEAAIVASDGSLLLLELGGGVETGWPLNAHLQGSEALLADVDGDSSADVIAAVAGVGVGAWSSEGARLENWPKPTDGAPLGDVVVGDVDGDGRPEVIAACEGGRLHCWDLGEVQYVSSAAIWPFPGRTAGNTRLAPLRIPSDTPGGGQGLGDQVPFRMVSLRAAPNPTPAGAAIFSELDGPEDRTARYEIRIFDAAGRLVRELRVPPRPAGSYRDYWDGSDKNGMRVPTGVYFCVASVDGSAASFRIMIVR